ncbi:MAG: sterol desaturase family protein [Sphingobacteriales bacterium]|nr:sterol desaturase family protein [Sphingobacteriales bacterium]
MFYWAHRFGHEINLFWGAHIVHHQERRIQPYCCVRQSWIHSLLVFFLLPIAFLGVDILTLSIVAGLNSFYQFWIHTKAVERMPKWFEAVFNSPAHHRVHHGVNPKYIDKNHAGMFIIWDKLFGTFHEEEEEPTYRYYQTSEQLNPAWANVHYYAEMYQSANNLKE